MVMDRREFLERSGLLLGSSSLSERAIQAAAEAPGVARETVARRVTLSLDGIWGVADSVSPDDAPATFAHQAPVPGLADSAVPSFPDVGEYLSPENLLDRRTFKLQPEEELRRLTPGPRQKRNYFWFKKVFRVLQKRETAILRINKAQFGTAVWLNGKKIGDHHSCFTAAYFNVTEALNWGGENSLVVRIGAHPGVVPKWVPTGTDFEKNKWIPGIYDSVFLYLCDNPVIETVQVAPRISPPEIVVQTQIKNYGPARQVSLTHRVKTWKGNQKVSQSNTETSELAEGEQKILTTTIPIPEARLWTPEDPFLYVLETFTEGDNVSTRFGMREFRFDSKTRRAYLNGKLYFMRGSNITLHRFFEDPKRGLLPWNKAWLRKLLVEIPKRMNWACFRFCIGPVPDQWLDIADEAGLLIQNEYFVWTLRYDFWKAWSVTELIQEYKEWMRDNWNHPSVVIWDATNETVADVFGDKVIPAVRDLDLSNRPWENSWNIPAGPNDPQESHPYLFLAIGKPPQFQMTDLETMPGYEPHIDAVAPTAHARILNEYGWLWLTRDGKPTVVSKPVYDKLLGADASPEERFKLDAYLLAGLTEFWRAYRNYAGVLHFVYLTANYPGAYTAGHFMDIGNLILEPHFEDYVREAFKPLGVYINFWQPEVPAGSKRRIFVLMVNDEYEENRGRLALSFQPEGAPQSAEQELPFVIPALGQQTFKFDVEMPRNPGKYLLRVTAHPAGKGHDDPTVSRRWLRITAARG